MVKETHSATTSDYFFKLVGVLHGSKNINCATRRPSSHPSMFANLEHQKNFDFISQWKDSYNDFINAVSNQVTLHKWSNILQTSMWWMKVDRVDLRKMLTLICSSKYVRKLALVLKVYEIMVQIVLIFLIWQRGNVWAKEAQIRNHAVCTIKWWLSNVLVNIPMDKLGLDVLASTVPVSF